MRKILVVDAKDSFVYNIVEAIRKEGKQVDVIDVDNLIFPLKETYLGIILSPGGGLPYEFPKLMKLIALYHDKTPMLGICLGHQALCTYFGANLYQIESPLHGHCGNLTLLEPRDPIFNKVSEESDIGLYHSWAIDSSNCEDLQLLATDERKCEMVVKHASLPLYGVQFHPESIISKECGQYIFRNWIEMINSL